MQTYGEMFIHARTYNHEDSKSQMHKISPPVCIRDWRVLWPEMFQGVNYDKVFTFLQVMIRRGECQIRKVNP
eukprot:499233-Rhodomonas_salina.1